MPASMLTRALIFLGRTCSWYEMGCSKNHSKHGALTTRAFMPIEINCSRAAKAR